ncbi:hypothetical protein [Clostridium estertheticum]|uniref:hypothetical protein n=1 Tax=Clostridium estertheticum TaxID=238834 RepID=UPI001C7CAF81|nr:hypothetical protein [Clostridium estertheticum]MBX4268451.1 hypothetical protein [Clostridium estertheticum]WLC81489.1 hypothetical protein KTC98_09895 [Clostridium estertheticum]
MGIAPNEYRNFYFGTGIEYFFVSQFYLMGYEAYTTNPDIGYDLIVTNQCRMKYKGAERINYNIQVKSSIRIKDYTRFYVPVDDFNMLKNNKEAVLICSYHKPTMQADPCSFVYDRTGDLSMDKAIDEGAMATFIDNYHNYSIDDAERMFKFVNFDVQYFWLNSEHLKRLEEEKFFVKYKDSKGRLYMILSVKFVKEEVGEQFLLVKKDGNDEHSIVPDYMVFEMRSVYYLLNENRSKTELQEGKLFIYDNPVYN